MEEINKENIKKIMDLKGETRGVVFQLDKEFILRERGEEGLKKLETEMKRLGCPLKYKEVTATEFYPVSWRILSLLAIKKVFNWDDKKIREMGEAAPKLDLFVKFFLRYFISIRRTVGQISRMWRKHYTVGEMASVEVDEEKKRIVLRLKDCNLHPTFCCYLEGYLSTMGKIILKQPVKVRETKCFFRGDKYHQYLATW